MVPRVEYSILFVRMGRILAAVPFLWAVRPDSTSGSKPVVQAARVSGSRRQIVQSIALIIVTRYDY
jgi:hypothetical protein